MSWLSFLQQNFIQNLIQSPEAMFLHLSHWMGCRTSPLCFDPVEQRVQWDKECSTYVNGYIIQMVLGPPNKQAKMWYF